MGEERSRRPGRRSALAASPVLLGGALLTLGACVSSTRGPPPPDPAPAVRSAVPAPSHETPEDSPSRASPAVETVEPPTPTKPETPWPGPSTPPPPPVPKWASLGTAPPDAASSGGVPPWMVAFEATAKQPMGMDPSDVRSFLDRQVKSSWMQEKFWPTVWDRVFLLMTPAHVVEVPAFALSKYEVTNAQWARFLQERTEKYTTQGGETLRQLASEFWLLEPVREDADIWRGFMNLIATNESVLMPVLNSTGQENWDPLVARAQEMKLPAGLEIAYPRYPYPHHWKYGSVPDDERRRPVRGVSWEQCEDFCQWAGFHLPTETEWERAARGTEGRWFPWGNEWDGTRPVWKKFNDAAREAAEVAKKKGTAPTVQPLDRDPPEPVDVDSFPQGATPEGIHHLIGNVSEYVGNRSGLYPGSKSGFKFSGSQLSRGGNHEDRAEVLLAADRNAESHQGALLAHHSVAGYGFRLTMYPLGGADIAAPVAQTWSDRLEPASPANWLPLPPGIEGLWRSLAHPQGAIRRRAAALQGFDLQNTAGVVQRSLANDDENHVFVVGAAQGVAFLPVKGFPGQTVRTPEHVAHFASDPDRPLCLGLLVGTDNLGVTVKTPQTEGEPKDTVVAFKDGKHLLEQPDTRLYTKADQGLMLVLDRDEVAVYVPDSTVGGVAKWRTPPLGFLADTPRVELDPARRPSEGRLDGTTAVLSARIPILREDGSPDATLPPIRVTIRVPLVAR